MNSLPLQRRLDALARDVEAMRDTLAAVALRMEAGGPLSPAAAAEALLAARRARTESLGSGLFADPAWDMLLALFAAAERGEALPVTRLCAAAGVPQTTALRWLEQLEQGRLIHRASDAADARRTLVSLAPDAREKMRVLLHRTTAALTGSSEAAALQKSPGK
jgi:DNA-binding MarR family transcriptional regulator